MAMSNNDEVATSVFGLIINDGGGYLSFGFYEK
jgi:hypothetical protein